MKKLIRLPSALLLLALLAGAASPGYAYEWPGVFDPLQLITLNLDMEPGDWNTVKADTSYSVEVPAKFWADGEEAILVAVRRKSADALGDKVSLKIDIDEYVDQKWSGLKKLSLENGDDVDVVAEGFAWYLNRVAAEVSDSGYTPGLASWVKLYVNGEYLGVYVNVEQPDKSFLKNRNLYTENETWLYKAGDIGATYELKVGEPDSPTMTALCYSPFDAYNAGSSIEHGKGKDKDKGNGKGKGSNSDSDRDGTDPGCSVPAGDEEMATELERLIDMEAMLTQGAVSAFTMGPDALFSKGKNFYFIDFENGKRIYIPWDLDTVFISKSPDGSIYGTETRWRGEMVLQQSPYEKVILNNTKFREQYDGIMGDLLLGPLSVDRQIDFLYQLESQLSTALEQDPNNNISGRVTERFDSLRDWVSRRVQNINQQLEN